MRKGQCEGYQTTEGPLLLSTPYIYLRWLQIIRSMQAVNAECLIVYMHDSHRPLEQPDGFSPIDGRIALVPKRIRRRSPRMQWKLSGNGRNTAGDINAMMECHQASVGTVDPTTASYCATLW